MPYQLYINGSWQNGAESAQREVINPATGDVVARAAVGTEKDGKAAMDAASAAWPGWSVRTAYDRAAYLIEAARIVRVRTNDIARVLTQENGKPLAEAVAETAGCAGWLEWYAEEGKRVYGRMVPSNYPNKGHWVLKQPIGVVASITPWNFPVSLMTRKLAPALASGCTIVCRPAGETPLSAMLMFECLHEAKLPAGTVNLVTGPPEQIAHAMLDHPACRKLAFTGSTEVGKQLMQLASRRVIKVSLELGGHAPLIVFPDVEITQAAEHTVVGKFRNAGQSCIAPTRIYVHRDIFEQFTAAVLVRVDQMRVGNGLDEGVEMGPMFHQRQLERIEAFVTDAVSKGARVLRGGQRLTGGVFDRGWFYAPTVLDRITADMRLTCEEVFGPVLPLIPFDREDEVIRAANATQYGLAAYVLVRDYSTAVRVCEALEYGLVGLNDPVPVVPQAPFGGWKESGIGREGGIEGIEAYLETKYISVGLS